MASFRVLYSGGSPAKNTKVSISVKGGGTTNGFTDSRGYVSIPTSGTYGKIIIKGRTVHDGSLNIKEVILS